MEDWRSAEFQAILDIKPTKVIEKQSEVVEEAGDTEEEKDKFEFKEEYNDILGYFQLPEPSKCSKDALHMVTKIARRLQQYSRSNDEFFQLLRAIEDNFMPEGDRYKRLDNVWYFLKKYNKDFKAGLSANRLLNKEQLEDEAKRTGNWARYLQYCKDEERAIRK